MIWVLVIIAVFVIYNAERMPELMNKFKKEVPNIVDSSKKMSKELKEKAQAMAEKKNTKSSKKSDTNND